MVRLFFFFLQLQLYLNPKHTNTLTEDESTADSRSLIKHLREPLCATQFVHLRK